jgi:hypothetical protein
VRISDFQTKYSSFSKVDSCLLVNFHINLSVSPILGGKWSFPVKTKLITGTAAYGGNRPEPVIPVQVFIVEIARACLAGRCSGLSLAAGDAIVEPVHMSRPR